MSNVINPNTLATVNAAATVGTVRAPLYGPARDYSPRQLLCNHKYIASKLAALADAGRTDEILLVHITTAAGGSEYRPIERFDVLPPDYTDRLYRLKPGTRKYTFVRVLPPAQYDDVGPDTAAIIANRAEPIPAAAALASIVVDVPTPEPTPAAQPDAAAQPSSPLVYPDGSINGPAVYDSIRDEIESAQPDATSADVDNGTRYRLAIITKNGRSKKRYLELTATDTRPDVIYRRVGTGRSTRYETAS